MQCFIDGYKIGGNKLQGEYYAYFDYNDDELTFEYLLDNPLNELINECYKMCQENELTYEDKDV